MFIEQVKTKSLFQNPDEIKELIVNKKWFYSIYSGIDNLFASVSKNIANRINTLAKRYENTLGDIDTEIKQVSSSLAELIVELTGDEFDMAGIKELEKLLGGE